jgi:hypothetical protein
VTVPGGSTTATFTITTAVTPLVTSDTPVRITASGVGQNTLTVSPLLGGHPFVNPGTIIGGASASGLVLLNFNAGSGGATVALSSNGGSLTVPASVTVPQGTSQATFTINSSYVTSTTKAKHHRHLVGRNRAIPHYYVGTGTYVDSRKSVFSNTSVDISATSDNVTKSKVLTVTP